MDKKITEQHVLLNALANIIDVNDFEKHNFLPQYFLFVKTKNAPKTKIHGSHLNFGIDEMPFELEFFMENSCTGVPLDDPHCCMLSCPSCYRTTSSSPAPP